MVAWVPGHGVLHGLLLAAECGRGPQVRFLTSCLPELVSHTVAPWVWTWMAALFLQYMGERASLRAMLGTASSVLLRISIV